MVDGTADGSSLNPYALVVYLPDPLAAFLRRLRAELEAAADVPRPHVTVLPPRQLPHHPSTLADNMGVTLSGLQTFPIEVGEILVFPVTSVIHASIANGSDKLRDLNRLLNDNGFRQLEAFPYCPHITLAQAFPLDALDHKLALARRAWGDYQGPRGFTVERLTLVRNAQDGRWLDVAEFPLKTREEPGPGRGDDATVNPQKA